MPVEVDAPLGNGVQDGNFTITDEGLFLYPDNQEITPADLLAIVNKFSDNNAKKLKHLYKYYRGDHDILKGPHQDSYKPDNRIVINFPRKAVTDFNGFFIGNMVKIDSPDEKVDEVVNAWENENNFEDIVLEASKESSEFGHSYFYVYQNQDGDTKVTTSSVLNTFLIYDNTQTRNVRYAVQFSKNVKGQLVIRLYDNTYIRDFVQDGVGTGGLTMTSSILNPYSCIPIIEVLENSDRLALCSDVLTLIDALDKAMSEKSNDVDYFADAYLKMINVDIDEESMKDFKKNRIINATGSSEYGQPDISFIEKPSSDETQEHLIDRLISAIYNIAGITNINDSSFSGNPTGVALQMKFKPMQNMAKAKSLKFKASLRQVFRCVFSVNDSISNDAWKDLTFKFTQNVPMNVSEVANLLNVGFGKLPLKVLYSQMPFIEDPDQAVSDFHDEQGMGQSTVQGLMTDNLDQDNEDDKHD